ncbi:MmpS family transport accessory protein [Amycolatopsis sp. NPDC021455]|uniref:MmpS family transport accessory protein n=1 Tax=Amycolatopsis sp. NPDC021455 TaxID=3154901 RepID=UPI003404F1C5
MIRPAAKDQRDRAARARSAGSVVVVLGVLAAAFAVTSSIVPKSTRGPAKEQPVAAPVVPAAAREVSHTVVYELLGENGARNVTYAGAGSALSQRSEVTTPWSASFSESVPAGRTPFRSIAARNPGPGELRCRIVVDDVVVAEKAVADESFVSCAV